MLLAQTKLVTSISMEQLAALYPLGNVVSLEPRETLFRKDDPSDFVYLILDGAIRMYPGRKDASDWLGQADFLGETGFLLGTTRAKSARADEYGCTLWCAPRSIFFKHRSDEETALWTRFLIGLAPYIRLRLTALERMLAPAPDYYDDYCDQWHPSIQVCAATLKRDDPWETASAIWHFVRNMPYRFCAWDVLASDTLRLGFGNCTTKANLQVALTRAAGLEGAYAECIVEHGLLSCLMPPLYRGQVRRQIKHYYGLVKIDNRWQPADASFPEETMRLIARFVPPCEALVTKTFEPRHPFNLSFDGEDPYDFNVLPSLDAITQKQSRFNEDHYSAMNILLDKEHGPLFSRPSWTKGVEEMVEQNPNLALHEAYVHLRADASQLSSLIQAVEGIHRELANPLQLQ